MELLIQRGADVNAEALFMGKIPISVLDYAIDSDVNKAVVQLLLDKGAKLGRYGNISVANKNIIKMLIEAEAADIKDVPLVKLDDEVIASYVNVCKKRFPEESWENPEDVFAKWGEEERLPAIYLSKIIDWIHRCCMEESLEKPLAPKALDVTNVSTVEDFFGCEQSNGIPTVTAQKKNKRALASAAQMQKGSPESSCKDGDVLPLRTEGRLEVVLDLTPGQKSRELDRAKTEFFKKELKALCDKINGLGIVCRFELNGVGHYNLRFSIDKEKYTSVSKRVESEGMIGVSFVHRSSHVCTDHYGNVFSYLVHIICNIAKDQPSKREECMALLDGIPGEVNRCAIEKLYPDVFGE